jgi:hypothetical protein
VRVCARTRSLAHTLIIYEGDGVRMRGDREMENTILELVENIMGKDEQLRSDSYVTLMNMTEEKVDWVYEIWDMLFENINHKNNHTRSIIGQLICNLAKSDYEKRIQKDFHKLINLTKDEKFVTARHCLLSIWKIGLTGQDNLELVLEGLSERYINCTEEKNCTLIRADIIQGFKNLYRELREERTGKIVSELIEKEHDEKYRKKYLSIWKKKD